VRIGSSRELLFTSESVTEGHPDKLADQISDAVLDRFLAEDPKARVACETLVARDLIVLAGEISSTAAVGDDELEHLARAVVRDVGYTDPASGFSADSCEVWLRIGAQSPEIARGVDHAADAPALIGAGDQGVMVGYATAETATLMPLPIMLAHALARRLAAVRHAGTPPWLGPDGKTQVTVRYRDGRPMGVERVLVSAQHGADVAGEELKQAIGEHVVAPVLAAFGFDGDLGPRLLVNPTGRFVTGGPAVDCGLTGRKIIIDTYGGMAHHGGGAFSGKDPTKVDRSASYAARHVARNIVAAGLARRCELQVAYAIGLAEPLSLMIETYGTGRLEAERLEAFVRERVDLRPGAIIERLALTRPVYRRTAAYGHFGREEPGFTWERDDLVPTLREAPDWLGSAP
jgi:S-adenosylmethionine synthetase